MTKALKLTRVLMVAATLIGSLVWQPLAAQPAQVTLSEGWRFVERDGDGLYRAICQGCHMAHGEGARGAGQYPALANNARLASAPYVIRHVLQGRKGMPAFGGMLDDAQVAEVANHVRSHFGNRFTDPVSAGDVKALR